MKSRHILTLALLFASATALAQGSDGQFVIKKDGNYLAHVYNGTTWVVQNATSFNPNTCLWYSGPNFNPSGTNHNYYFYDGENYRFLSAPLEGGALLSLSASLPSTSLLRNTDQVYYFYDWDPDAYGRGLARGHQYTGVSSGVECEACGGNWHAFQNGNHECWEVYWVEFDGQWRLTPQSHYSRNPEDDDGHGGVPNAGLFRGVSITEHSIQVTSTDPEHPGLTGLDIPNSEMTPDESQTLSATISGAGFSYNYIPAYTQYVFEGGTHYYYGGEDHHNTAPVETSGSSTVSNATYEWTISGEGANYLTFDSGGELVSTSTDAMPTVYYSIENLEGRKVATVTLTVTYSNTGATQTLSANILLNVACQSPGISDVSITYEDVTISWYPTADSYKVYLTTNPADWGSPLYAGDATSFTFTGLAYNTPYYYKVTGICGSEEKPATQHDFTTPAEPGLLVYGAIFGGGRMADVSGKTEVVVINCDSIGALFGGNDIAGTVGGDDGAIITLGVNSGDTYASYGTTGADISIGDVYGGGNGYYAYNGSSFVPASYDSEYDIPDGASIKAMTPMHTVGDVVWTNTTGSTVHLVCPTISQTKITVSNNYVVIDSLFGGAKNAILNNTSKDVDIIINGGTIYSVFGGNNFGGSLGYWSNEYITVNNTSTKATVSDYNNGKLGRDFGIGYVFGGGNKVMGQQVHITVAGGQCDTVFGGGNAADVRSTEVIVNCELGAASGGAFGKVYFGGISSVSPLTIDENYGWAGTGIYNIRTLFGGNNKATMSGLPTLTLTSGGIGTVYGGGNAGDMLADQSGTITYAGTNTSIKYSTHVVMNSPNMLVDNLYGGCQMSNVDYSTWVELKNGHVGTVYGGCNVSGDVGSTKIHPDNNTSPSLDYQAVQGATYVVATGGTVYRNLFAGSNGFYHCNNGTVYVSGINYGDPEGHYLGMNIPTHNETYVIVSKDDEAHTATTVKGNVYAGGNMAPVGFTIAYVAAKPAFPALVGLSSVRMNGGTVYGDVYGGGNMASINGSNEVQVSGGTIHGSLYGGNDRTGAVAEISNRILPDSYSHASDGVTSLENVHSYISLTGTPEINTVFGGGNGDYDYSGGGDMQYCDATDQPIQSNTFVDINIADGGHISTVYGGGDGVHVIGSCTVFLNVDTPTYGSGHDHVGTIFGGNNKGDLNDLVPNIILLHGQVNTVYGGCNEGALGHHQNMTLGGNTYDNIGSLVYLRSSYDGDGSGPGTSVTPTAKVSGNIYGGCRMNGVTYNSLVLVEAGDHTGVGIFGGSDISGNIGDTSRVVVTGGTVGDIYGGGNGNYIYANNNVYDLSNNLIAEGTAQNPITAPFSTISGVVLVEDGNAANLYAGGYAGESGETHALVSGGAVSGKVFGGGNRAGVVIVDTNPDPLVTEYTSGDSFVEMTGGTVGTGIYGGCNATGDIEGDATVSITGGTIGASGVGNGANIHGGGYGESTTVAGDVTVNYGDIDADQSLFPKLYGELYGGSAFGQVNTDCDNTTTVNILNGSIIGAVYGGGLGETGAGNDTKGQVNGVVHVNVGANATPDPVGKATLIGSDVFGCNNTNGSPQCDVYVDVYQTAHIPTNEYDYFGEDRTYAIYRVFGGGNSADYAPASTQTTYVTIHGCYNTVEEVYGASNAADATRVHTIVDGGRFNFIFGGGNGTVSTSNVTVSTYSRFNGGHVGYYFGGSNRLGTCENIDSGTESNPAVNCGEAISDYFFNGGNQADEMDLTLNLSCGDGERESLVIYGGCRLGSVYGFIEVNVHGGKFGNLFGGCMGSPGSPGSPGVQANVKKYPTVAEIQEHLDDDYYPTKLINLYNEVGEAQYAANYAGKRGDIIINVYGGAIGNLYGGCDLNGNVEGKIIINVESEGNDCGLFVGNVFGASNYTNYTPSDPTAVSPEVKIIKGTIGGTSPQTLPGATQDFEGNVFGGSNRGNVTSNPKVIIGSTDNNKPVTINGSVYGGGNQGDVTGSPQVIIVPTE